MSGREEAGKSSSEVSKDDELSHLLDSSLNDFGRSSTNPLGADDFAEFNTHSEEFDPELTRKAAADFKSMMKQLAEVQKVVVQQMTNAAVHGGDGTHQNGDVDISNGSAHDDQAGDASSSAQDLPEKEDVQFAEAFIKNMQYIAEKAEKVQESKTDEEFAEAMKQLSEDETYEAEFLPFMQGLMGSLLSKEMMYAPMKDLCDKYPGWIEENKSTLDAETLDRYQKQLHIMQAVCREYDNETPDEVDQDKIQRFERIVASMQKMQAYGYPPEGLIGSMPPGWAFDAKSGLPQAVDVEKAAETCTLM